MSAGAVPSRLPIFLPDMKTSFPGLIVSLALSAVSVDAAPHPNQAVDPDLELSLLASGIQEGMEMTIASDGRVFIAERPG